MSNSGYIASLKVIPLELRFHGLGSVIFNTCMKSPQIRQVKEKKQTVVALDCGLNVFSKASMLEIQTSEKRVESLWAHQGLIRINDMNVMSLPGEQFLNKGESVPPPSPTHLLTWCSPPSATGGHSNKGLIGCRPLNLYIPDSRTTRNRLLYKLPQSLVFCYANMKGAKRGRHVLSGTGWVCRGQGFLIFLWNEVVL